MTQVLLLILPIGQISGQPADWGMPPSPGEYDASGADVARWKGLARTGDIRLAIAEINVAVTDLDARRRYVTLAKTAYRSERRRRVVTRAETRGQQRRDRIAARDQLAAFARMNLYAPTRYTGSSCNHGRRYYTPSRSMQYSPEKSEIRYSGSY